MNGHGFYESSVVAVTGGLGLIGSFLSEELLNAGATVVLIDDESKGSWKYTQELREKVDYRKGSLENRSFALDALEGCNYVFHLASRAYGVGYSQLNNFEMFQFNDLVNTNTLDGIAHNHPKRALVVSSSCIYPDDGPTPMSDTSVITGEPEMVNWGYGWAKRILEQKAAIYQKETGIPITIVRPFNIYGERYTWVGENSQAIPMLTKRVMDYENPLVVWGSGNQRRNYIHARDCVKIMMLLVEKGYNVQPVNIGTEETITVKKLVYKLAELAGRDIEIVTDSSKPEGRFTKSADSRLLTATLGNDFSFKINLDEGLRKMIDWYRVTFIQTGKN